MVLHSSLELGNGIFINFDEALDLSHLADYAYFRDPHATKEERETADRLKKLIKG